MSDGVAPSKGAMRATAFLFADHDARIYVHGHGQGWSTFEEVAAIIDRETKSPQMADLLRELMMLETPTTRNEIARFVVLRSKAERLLSELEVKP